MKKHLDIVEYIGRDIALRKRGGGFVGLCPFHNERNPSFNVNPVTQRWICWGCGKKGDIFDYIGYRDGVSFVGAYRIAFGENPGPREEPVLNEQENIWCESAIEISRLWLKILNYQIRKNVCRDRPTDMARMNWISLNTKQKIDIGLVRQALEVWKGVRPLRTTALVTAAIPVYVQPFIFGTPQYRSSCLFLVEDA